MAKHEQGDEFASYLSPHFAALNTKVHKYLVRVVVLDDVADRVDGGLVGVGEAAAGAGEEV